MDDGKLLAGIALLLLGIIIVVPRLRTGLPSAVPTSEPNKPAAVNCETWEWTDWKGRPRRITVHREVR